MLVYVRSKVKYEWIHGRIYSRKAEKGVKSHSLGKIDCLKKETNHLRVYNRFFVCIMSMDRKVSRWLISCYMCVDSLIWLIYLQIQISLRSNRFLWYFRRKKCLGREQKARVRSRPIFRSTEISLRSERSFAFLAKLVVG